MQTIKHLLTMLLMTYLTLSTTSCESLAKYNFKPMIHCDISFKFNRCRCRCYDLNYADTLAPKECLSEDQILQLDIGPEQKAWNLDLESCERYAGFSSEDWAIEVQPKTKARMDWVKSHCK